jgi:hypothetical protein
MSSLHVLAAGTLIANPQSREGARGKFVTATVRTGDDEPVFVGLIAFRQLGDRLLAFGRGDAIAVSGRGRLTSWISSDGTARHGLSVAVDEVIGAQTRREPRQAKAKRRASRPTYRDDGSSLANDRVDDLFLGEGVQ